MMCFRKFLVAKKFKDKIRGRGKYQDFLRKFFVSQCQKNAVGEPFSLSLISGIEKR